MEQLLQLKSVPIEFGFRVQNARYEMKQQQSSVNITRERGSLRVSNQPARVLLDTYDARSSMGLKTASDSVREAGDIGRQAALDATANFAEEGNALMDIQYGTGAISDIAFSRMQTQIDSMLGFLPSVPVNIDYEPYQLDMQYEMDKLHFDWRTNSSVNMEYVPSKMEYFVTEYPRLEITYVGRPVYAPPSADPEYVPSPYDVLA